jgi:hypothetical protein
MGCHTFKSWIGKTIPGTEVFRCHAFCASRCFRSELRRMILAFAARTASALVSLVFGSDALKRSASSEPGIAGSNGAGLVEP